MLLRYIYDGGFSIDIELIAQKTHVYLWDWNIIAEQYYNVIREVQLEQAYLTQEIIDTESSMCFNFLGVNYSNKKYGQVASLIRLPSFSLEPDTYG